MTSYYLMTEEDSDIDLDSIFDRVKVGVQRLAGKEDVDVAIRHDGVSWVVSKKTTFIVRISSSDMIASDAEDVAAFSADAQLRPHIANATTRFICHDLGGAGREPELNYLMSALSDGHESWCFRIDDRRFVSTGFDESALIEKQRLPRGLETAAFPKRTKLTRMFAEPIPTETSGEVQFLSQLTEIQPDVLDAFSDALVQYYGYEEIQVDTTGRTFVFMKQQHWQLQVDITPTEIYFSTPRSKSVSSDTLFEAYQTSSESVGNMPLCTYDAHNDSWVDY